MTNEISNSFSQGKYEGRTFEDILDSDPGYIKFMIEKASARDYPRLISYLTSRHFKATGEILNKNQLNKLIKTKQPNLFSFGKYSGQTVEEVAKNDIDYIIWLVYSNIDKSKEYYKNKVVTDIYDYCTAYLLTSYNFKVV